MTPDAESTPARPPRDDGLEWLREIRRQLAAEANYDPYEMGRILRERQKREGRTVYRTERVLVPVAPAHPAAANEESCVLREEPPAE
jgi:hypothetical protein